MTISYILHIFQGIQYSHAHAEGIGYHQGLADPTRNSIQGACYVHADMGTWRI